MARSLGDWYADHTDNSDPGDDEHVERQPAWDMARSDRQLNHGANSRRRAAKRSSVRTAPAAGLTPKQVAVRAEVLAMRRRFPHHSFKGIVDQLGQEGVHVTRRDVAAIVNQRAPQRRVNHGTPRRKPADARRSTAAPLQRVDQSPQSASSSSTRRAKQNTNSQAKKLSPRPEANRQRELSQQRATNEDRRRTGRVPRRQPGKLPPMSLRLDEPKPRRLKKAGWHRAKNVKTPAAEKPRSEPMETCKACGVVPSPLGVCRCT